MVLDRGHDWKDFVRLQFGAGLPGQKSRQGRDLPEEELAKVAKLIAERELHMIEIARLTAELAEVRRALGDK